MAAKKKMPAEKAPAKRIPAVKKAPAKKKAPARKASAKTGVSKAVRSAPSLAAAGLQLWEEKPAGKPVVPHARVPLHLQDKWGFCGAACIMMLLEDAFPGRRLKSQSELMRDIKKWRDKKLKEEKPLREQNPYHSALDAESHYAWHASPREIEAVLNAEFAMQMKDPPGVVVKRWELLKEPTSDAAKIKARQAVNDGCAVMALIWHAALETKYAHWVVIERHEDHTGYRVLDPAVTGFHERIRRFESFQHGTRVWRGSTPLHFCPCRVWRDEHQRLRAAEKIWIHDEKLEELLDEGAARAGGLRYLILRTGNALIEGSKAAYKAAAVVRDIPKSFSDLVREMDMEESARHSLKQKNAGTSSKTS
jgi:hypothetical protein